MSDSDSIARIAAEWEPDTGFFWKARKGQFDPTAFARTCRALQSLAIEKSADIPRRLVSLLWYMPLFLSWQTERVRENGGDVQSYLRAVVSITNEIERLLGTP